MAITKTCGFCSQQFIIDDEDLAFYEKIGVPAPRLCPDDRQRRRASFRNERNFYRRKCDGTGKEIISMFSPDKPFKIYDQEYWWGDKWNPLDYGQNFDFERPFFEQFRELQLKVPRISLFNYQSENSYYTNHSGENKNCYMSCDVGGCEDVYHSYWVTYDKDCIDCSYTHKSQLCYQCIYCENCFNCDFCNQCEQCTDCAYCYDCKGCTNCFGCAGLRKKQYYVFNKQVSPEEYKKTVEYYAYSYQKQREALGHAREIKLTVPHRYAYMIQSEDCTGNYIYRSKNAKLCFDAVDLWDCKYCYNTLNAKNGYDCYQPGFNDSEVIYEVHAGNGFFNCKFLHLCRNSSNLDYCDTCYDSENLFGCVGIKRGKYCILNKQYDEASFDRLRMTIINHMKRTGEYGEFFPFICSPFGYNESKAQEFYPLTRQQAQEKGLQWSTYEPPALSGDFVSPPDDIRQTDEGILGKILKCETTGKPFKLIQQEFDFYKKKHLAIPRESPDQRHKNRMLLQNPRHLWDRKCAKCQTAIQTTYAPDRPEMVYCEKCYLESVY